MKLYDAHNHLQDERFAAARNEILRQAGEAGVTAMVVNGVHADDWASVEQLAKEHACVLPSFGLHPWFHEQRSADWLDQLEGYLSRTCSGVGEIGLDRWKEGLPYEGQEPVFLDQWNLAVRLNRPVSVHCLRAWGKLLDLLKANPGPECGFLLHSYGGPAEMVPAFVKLGAYFSFPGYYARENKERQRGVFSEIPLDRLLIETDAPDQQLPDDLNKFPLQDADGMPLNHPANLRTVYDVVADLRGMDVDELAVRVEENFMSLFGALL